MIVWCGAAARLRGCEAASCCKGRNERSGGVGSIPCSRSIVASRQQETKDRSPSRPGGGGWKQRESSAAEESQRTEKRQRRMGAAAHSMDGRRRDKKKTTIPGDKRQTCESAAGGGAAAREERVRIQGRAGCASAEVCECLKKGNVLTPCA